MSFIFVTYWWGRNNLNFNTQRPCPMDTKFIVNTGKCLYERKRVNEKQILKYMYESGRISEMELDNEIIQFDNIIKTLKKIGLVIVKKGNFYNFISITPDCIKMIYDNDMLNGKITYKSNPFRKLGKTKRSSYHQNASDKKLCKSDNCYQFPFKFEKMIEIWEESLRKLNIEYHAQEYKIAPRDFSKSKSIKGLFDFRTNQEAMNYKGEFILEMLNKYKKPIVYIDGDMKIHKYPKIFDATNFDFMLRHWQFDPMNFTGPHSFAPMLFETSGGIMYFNTTQRSKNVLKSWISKNKEIMKKGQPGADDRILTMVIHKNNFLYNCRWLPLPSTYLWLTNKFSLDIFHGNILPKHLHVVIDHPHCLTTEEMAKDQGAVLNKSGSRYPIDYYKYVKGNSLNIPFQNNVNTLSNVKNIEYQKRLFDLVKSNNQITSDLQDISSNKIDFIVDKKSNKTYMKNTVRGKRLMSDYFKSVPYTNQPTAKEFLKWIKSKPYTLMTTRIEVKQ